MTSLKAWAVSAATGCSYLELEVSGQELRPPRCRAGLSPATSGTMRHRAGGAHRDCGTQTRPSSATRSQGPRCHAQLPPAPTMCLLPTSLPQDPAPPRGRALPCASKHSPVAPLTQANPWRGTISKEAAGAACVQLVPVMGLGGWQEPGCKP